MTYDFCVQLLNGALHDVEGRVEYTVTSWGRPAQTYGPPERCYPGDPVEVELGAVEVITGRNPDAKSVHDGWNYRLLDENDANDKWLADLIRAAIDLDAVADEALEQQEADRADAMERRWEERRDARWEAA